MSALKLSGEPISLTDEQDRRDVYRREGQLVFHKDNKPRFTMVTSSDGLGKAITAMTEEKFLELAFRLIGLYQSGLASAPFLHATDHANCTPLVAICGPYVGPIFIVLS